MLVLVQDAAESVASSHIQVDDVGAAGDRFGRGLPWCAVVQRPPSGSRATAGPPARAAIATPPRCPPDRLGGGRRLWERELRWIDSRQVEHFIELLAQVAPPSARGPPGVTLNRSGRTALNCSWSRRRRRSMMTRPGCFRHGHRRPAFDRPNVATLHVT